MRACMNGNGPPIRVAGDTANLEIVELASVPVSKCLLRTKYDNRSRRTLGMSMALRLVDDPDREAVCHDGATRGLAGHGLGRERTIYGTRSTCVTVSLTGTADHCIGSPSSYWGLIYQPFSMIRRFEVWKLVAQINLGAIQYE